jgi:Tfp pilus assembly protein PilF
MQIPAKEIALMMEAGHICRYARRFREAREIFQGVAALPRGREIADLALAAVACDEHKFDEAEALCRRTLQLNPRSAAACAQLAEVQIIRGDTTSAAQTLKRAYDLRPGEPLLALIKSLLHLTKLTSRQTQAAPNTPPAA